jgi:hypothetical protein
VPFLCIILVVCKVCYHALTEGHRTTSCHALPHAAVRQWSRSSCPDQLQFTMAPLSGQKGRKAHRSRPRRKTPPCSSTASGFYTELSPTRRQSVITYQTCFYPAITLSSPSSLLCVLTPFCRVIAFDPSQVPHRCSNVDGSASAARVSARGQCRYLHVHGAVLMACSGERIGKPCPCEVSGFCTMNHPRTVADTASC